jgi:hypothetical protein
MCLYFQKTRVTAPIMCSYSNSKLRRSEPLKSTKPLHRKTEKPMARGVSDQRKEQIMRSVTYIFAAALLAMAGQFSAASAQSAPAQSPQTDVPQAQSPAQTNPAASIPEQKLDAAVAAMQRIANLERDYLQLLDDTPPDDRPRIDNEAGIAIEKAIIEQGLSVEEYTTIVKMAQNDPQVRQKIIKRLQAPAE